MCQYTKFWAGGDGYDPAPAPRELQAQASRPLSCASSHSWSSSEVLPDMIFVLLLPCIPGTHM